MNSRPVKTTPACVAKSLCSTPRSTESYHRSSTACAVSPSFTRTNEERWRYEPIATDNHNSTIGERHRSNNINNKEEYGSKSNQSEYEIYQTESYGTIPSSDSPRQTNEQTKKNKLVSTSSSKIPRLQLTANDFSPTSTDRENTRDNERPLRVMASYSTQLLSIPSNHNNKRKSNLPLATNRRLNVSHISSPRSMATESTHTMSQDEDSETKHELSFAVLKKDGNTKDSRLLKPSAVKKLNAPKDNRPPWADVDIPNNCEDDCFDKIVSPTNRTNETNYQNMKSVKSEILMDKSTRQKLNRRALDSITAAFCPAKETCYESSTVGTLNPAYYRMRTLTEDAEHVNNLFSEEFPEFGISDIEMNYSSTFLLDSDFTASEKIASTIRDSKNGMTSNQFHSTTHRNHSQTVGHPIIKPHNGSLEETTVTDKTVFNRSTADRLKGKNTHNLMKPVDPNSLQLPTQKTRLMEVEEEKRKKSQRDPPTKETIRQIEDKTYQFGKKRNPNYPMHENTVDEQRSLQCNASDATHKMKNASRVGTTKSFLAKLSTSINNHTDAGDHNSYKECSGDQPTTQLTSPVGTQGKPYRQLEPHLSDKTRRTRIPLPQHWMSKKVTLPFADSSMSLNGCRLNYHCIPPTPVEPIPYNKFGIEYIISVKRLEETAQLEDILSIAKLLGHPRRHLSNINNFCKNMWQTVNTIIPQIQNGVADHVSKPDACCVKIIKSTISRPMLCVTTATQLSKKTPKRATVSDSNYSSLVRLVYLMYLQKKLNSFTKSGGISPTHPVRNDHTNGKRSHKNTHSAPMVQHVPHRKSREELTRADTEDWQF